MYNYNCGLIVEGVFFGTVKLPTGEPALDTLAYGTDLEGLLRPEEVFAELFTRAPTETQCQDWEMARARDTITPILLKAKYACFTSQSANVKEFDPAEGFSLSNPNAAGAGSNLVMECYRTGEPTAGFKTRSSPRDNTHQQSVIDREHIGVCTCVIVGKLVCLNTRGGAPLSVDLLTSGSTYSSSAKVVDRMLGGYDIACAAFGLPAIINIIGETAGIVANLDDQSLLDVDSDDVGTGDYPVIIYMHRLAHDDGPKESTTNTNCPVMTSV
ncbi:hypothetical protein EDB19DRAFT_1829143 [Suillus lakei]|nr:hypothetical protein EDB19DRAFT_1829143 [Suillus lakei]